MGSFSVFHWLILMIIFASLIVPYWRIFPRAGWPSALSILMVVPLLNLVLLWVVAFKKWPGDA
ncbi:MAG: hypothetical protein E5W87_07945 [Mesorhizobium sp.]|nr:MAG: hypothetical protein E5W87_07945 [Mesorhizobium sp.]